MMPWEKQSRSGRNAVAVVATSTPDTPSTLPKKVGTSLSFASDRRMVT